MEEPVSLESQGVVAFLQGGVVFVEEMELLQNLFYFLVEPDDVFLQFFVRLGCLHGHFRLVDAVIDVFVALDFQLEFFEFIVHGLKSGPQSLVVLFTHFQLFLQHTVNLLGALQVFQQLVVGSLEVFHNMALRILFINQHLGDLLQLLLQVVDAHVEFLDFLVAVGPMSGLGDIIEGSAGETGDMLGLPTFVGGLEG